MLDGALMSARKFTMEQVRRERKRREAERRTLLQASKRKIRIK